MYKFHIKYNMLQICAHISFQVLRRDLVRSLKRKRPEVELDQVILHMITRCLIAPNQLCWRWTYCVLKDRNITLIPPTWHQWNLIFSHDVRRSWEVFEMQIRENSSYTCRRLFGRLEHNPYSPKLAPMDFDIFPRLKKELRGVRDADKRDSSYTCRRLFGSLTNNCIVPCTTNGSTDIKTVSMRRENTSKNF